MNVQGFPESGCVFRDTPFLAFGFHGVEYCRGEARELAVRTIR